MKRLRGFRFVVTRSDSTREDVVFYALDAHDATRLAAAWARRDGHRRVELQDEQDTA